MQPGVHLHVTKLQMTRSHNTANHGGTTCTRQASVGSASSLGNFFCFVLLLRQSLTLQARLAFMQSSYLGLLSPEIIHTYQHTSCP